LVVTGLRTWPYLPLRTPLEAFWNFISSIFPASSPLEAPPQCGPSLQCEDEVHLYYDLLLGLGTVRRVLSVKAERNQDVLKSIPEASRIAKIKD
jgi:hypothetical protein